MFYFAERRKGIAVGRQWNLYAPYPSIKEY